VSNIGKAKKKPVIVDFVLWTGTVESTRNVLVFMGQNVVTNCNKSSEAFLDYHEQCLNFGLKIETLEGVMKASVNDFIIKGVNGEFYPCKPDIFHKTYDILDEN